MDKKTTKASRPKREPYVSLTKQECALLRTVDPRERWFYIENKWIANFRDGVAGYHLNQALAWPDLALLVPSAPSASGITQPASAADAEQALRTLEQAGLVSDISTRADNGGLRFTLPLSPIKFPEPPAKAEPIEAWAADDSAPSVGNPDNSASVLVVNRSNTPPNTDNTDGARRIRTGADGAGATPSVETPTPAPRALTLTGIEQYLAAAGFRYPNSEKSRRFYADWIAHHVSPDEFERVAKSVANLFPTPLPDQVDKELTTRRERRKHGFGEVAL